MATQFDNDETGSGTSGGEIRYVTDGGDVFIVGNADEVRSVIHAEANRLDAVRALEEVRLETRRFEAGREDIRVERIDNALNELKQSVMGSNPFESLFNGLLGSSPSSDDSFSGMGDFSSGRTSAD